MSASRHCRRIESTQSKSHGTGVVARFAARGDLLDLGGEVLRDVERSEQRCADDQLVAQGRFQQQRKPAVGRRLILDGAAHDQILVAVAPVGRQDLHQAVYAFGDEEEAQVAARADHLPRLGAPCVGLFDQKIRREAGVDHLSGRNLEPSVAAPAHGRLNAEVLRTSLLSLSCRSSCRYT